MAKQERQAGHKQQAKPAGDCGCASEHPNEQDEQNIAPPGIEISNQQTQDKPNTSHLGKTNSTTNTQ